MIHNVIFYFSTNVYFFFYKLELSHGEILEGFHDDLQTETLISPVLPNIPARKVFCWRDLTIYSKIVRVPSYPSDARRYYIPLLPPDLTRFPDQINNTLQTPTSHTTKNT